MGDGEQQVQGDNPKADQAKLAQGRTVGWCTRHRVPMDGGASLAAIRRHNKFRALQVVSGVTPRSTFIHIMMMGNRGFERGEAGDAS